VHCCSAVFTDVGVADLISYPRNHASKADTHISEYYRWYVSLHCNETEIQKRAVRIAVLQQNVLAVIRHRQRRNLQLPAVRLFVEFNTTMALAVLTEERDFVGAGVGQSCGCGTAQVSCTEITVF